MLFPLPLQCFHRKIINTGNLRCLHREHVRSRPARLARRWELLYIYVAFLTSDRDCVNPSMSQLLAIGALHYSDVIMDAIVSQIISLTIVYSAVYSDDQRKHQSSASLAFVWGIHREPVNSPHKWPVTRKKVSIWWRHHGMSAWVRILHQSSKPSVDSFMNVYVFPCIVYLPCKKWLISRYRHHMWLMLYFLSRQICPAVDSLKYHTPSIYWWRTALPTRATSQTMGSQIYRRNFARNSVILKVRRGSLSISYTLKELKCN